MWVLAIKPMLPEREKFSTLLNSPASYLLILMFWHFQLTFKSSFWGERKQQEGARLEQGRGQQMGTPALEGRERGAPGPC